MLSLGFDSYCPGGQDSTHLSLTFFASPHCSFLLVACLRSPCVSTSRVIPNSSYLIFLRLEREISPTIIAFCLVSASFNFVTVLALRNLLRLVHLHVWSLQYFDELLNVDLTYCCIQVNGRRRDRVVSFIVKFSSAYVKSKTVILLMYAGVFCMAHASVAASTSI